MTDISSFTSSSRHHAWRQLKSRTMAMVMFCCAVVVMAPLFLVLYFLVREGASSLDWNFFTQLPKPTGEMGGGIAHAIVGTMVLLAMAAVIGVPLGVMGGIYLAEYGSDRGNKWIRFAADVVNGVPPIVWGMVVYGLLVV